MRWQTDPAGGRGDHELERFELCPQCAGLALAIVMKQVEVSYDHGLAIVKSLKGRIKKRQDGGG